MVSLKAPDRNGKSADVVLGFDDLDGYVANFNGPSNAFFGAIIGRYANRIAHGSFTLDGKNILCPGTMARTLFTAARTASTTWSGKRSRSRTEWN